jgi:hypothetical protein
LSSAEIGKAIGRSRRTVDNYIADLRAKTQVELDLKIFRMSQLGIPQERIALRLVQTRDIIRDHLGKKAVLPKSPNADLKRGFTVPQVAEKHACPACPVAPADGTGVGPEDRTWVGMKYRTGVGPEDRTGIYKEVRKSLTITKKCLNI